MRSIITALTFYLTIISFALPAIAQIPWNHDLRTGRDRAIKEGKLLLLHFYTDPCSFCTKLENGAFRAPILASEISRNYIPVKVNEKDQRELASKFGVSRYPTDVIVDPSTGKVLKHRVSPQAVHDYLKMLDRSQYMQQIASEPKPRPSESPVAARSSRPDLVAQGTRQPVTAQRGLVQQNPYAMNAAPPTQPAYQPNAYAQGPLEGGNRSFHPGEATTPSVTHESASMANSQLMANVSPPTPHEVSSSFPNAQGLPVDGGETPANFGGTHAKAAGYSTAGVNHGTYSPSTTQEPEPNYPSLAQNAEADDQSAFGATTDKNANVSQESPQIALQGYCPVAVLERGRWIPGATEYGVVHLGKLYLLSSVDAKTKFLEKPEQYTPVMNGIDVVLFLDKKQVVDGSREWGMVDQKYGRMFFFANEDTMNYFHDNYNRYVDFAIKVTKYAAAKSNAMR